MLADRRQTVVGEHRTEIRPALKAAQVGSTLACHDATAS
jgi:hypothetical protein